MKNLYNISRIGKWSDSVDDLNENFINFESEINVVEEDIKKCKGLFPTVFDLNEAYPNPDIGSWAYVGDSLPALIYVYRGTGWANTGKTGGSRFSPSKYFANSSYIPGGADKLFLITTEWKQYNGSWSNVSDKKLKINSSVTEYKLNITSLRFGYEGELLKVSTTDPPLYIFNKGSFVSMVMTSSSGITKTFTTGPLSWTIDNSFYTNEGGTKRLPVAGDTMRVALYFKSESDDTKVVSILFKFSN